MVLYKDETVVSDHTYQSILPKLLITVGAVIAALSLIVMVAGEAEVMVLGVIIGIVVLAFGFLVMPMADFRLIVTTKRVIQEGPFNQFVSIPLTHVSVVSSNGNQVHIGAVNGGIHLGVPDGSAVCDTIAGLVNQLQQVEPVADNAVPMYGAWPPKSDQPEARFWVCECGARNREAASACSGCGKPHGYQASNVGYQASGDGFVRCTCGAMVPRGKCPLCGATVL